MKSSGGRSGSHSHSQDDNEFSTSWQESISRRGHGVNINPVSLIRMCEGTDFGPEPTSV